MNLTKILTYVFFVVAILLALYLFNSIKSEIDHKKRISEVESRVIEKLKMIREAQTAYLASNQEYTGDWDKLLSFVDTGKIYIVQNREEIITLDYGADSVIVHVDTLGSVDVMDSLFNERKYPGFNLDEMSIIPETDGKKFEMFADKITKGNVEVDVVEVKDIAPFDRDRKEDSEARNRQPLRFGSRTQVTISGNWE